MKCPQCPDVALAMNDRQGIEIDYCPSCRGIWLDRGELDKLLERAPGSASTARPPDQARADFPDSDLRWGSPRAARHRKCWLDEIFD